MSNLADPSAHPHPLPPGAALAPRDVADRLAVSDAVTSMLHATDARDWARVRSAFAGRVRVDYASLSGVPAAETDADAMIAGWRGVLPGFDATAHLTGPLVTELRGDRATTRCALIATHRLGPVQGGPTWVVKGRYEIGLERRATPADGGAPAWQITALTLHTVAVEGDLSLPAKAQARAVQAQSGAATR